MRALSRVVVPLVAAGTALFGNAPATALDLVQNGGFEGPDLSAWRIRALAYERAAAADAPEGAYVLRLSVDPSKGDPQWVAQQVLPFVTPGASYGWSATLAVAGGMAEARALIEWMDRDDGFGNSLLTSVTPWTTRADGVFQLVTSRATAPQGARSALLRIEIRNLSSQVELRIDAVTADGPAPASPTPTSTLTAAPSETPTPTPSPSATPSPTVTATPGPGHELRNPGFEDIADGAPVAWQKYGGELVTTARARSGERAGLLRSATVATKWAYQTVLVEGGTWYEFDAWVLSDDPAVERALLRVSWYASADGSGAALASVDSTDSLGAPERAYRHLTTGPVQAPPDARSGRPRILLAPAGAAPASIVIDDAGWRRAAPPTATVAPTVTAAPTPSPSPEASGAPSAAARRPRSGATRSEVRAATVSPAERFPAVAASAGRSPALPTPRAAAPRELESRRDGRSARWWLWTAGAAAFAASAAAATSVITIIRRRIS